MPERGLNEVGEQYSYAIALMYVFNLIVGTGVLTMPKALGLAGYVIGLVLIVFIAFMSLVTATFIIEAMACANAFNKWNLRQKQSKKQDKEVADVDEVGPIEAASNASAGSSVNNSGDEQQPLIDKSPEKESESDYFEIKERVEVGEMASMFFNKCGVVAFYICIVVYLYGDLAIYAAAVPKSLRDVVCNFNPNNATLNITNITLKETDPCFRDDGDGLTRFQTFQIMLTVFFLLMLPFMFFNAQKTKWLQIFTSALRWASFLIMISVAIARIAKGKGAQPRVANIHGLPALFGACIYSFMCHHSLPSLISPVKDKSRLTSLFIIDYLIILCFYTFLCMTAVYAFDPLEDLYSLNFAPFTANPANSADLPGAWIWVKYFIALFPVLAISSSFPIIAITLRNNLKTLFAPKGRPYHKCVDRVLFPFVTIIPPVFVVYFTNDVGILVSITGAYAGAGIQYLLPAFLVFNARKNLDGIFGSAVKNKHKSPFKQAFWIWLVVGWCFVALIFVTYDLISTRIRKGSN